MAKDPIGTSGGVLAERRLARRVVRRTLQVRLQLLEGQRVERDLPTETRLLFDKQRTRRLELLCHPASPVVERALVVGLSRALNRRLERFGVPVLDGAQQRLGRCLARAACLRFDDFRRLAHLSELEWSRHREHRYGRRLRGAPSRAGRRRRRVRGRLRKRLGMHSLLAFLECLRHVGLRLGALLETVAQLARELVRAKQRVAQRLQQRELRMRRQLRKGSRSQLRERLQASALLRRRLLGRRALSVRVGRETDEQVAYGTQHLAPRGWCHQLGRRQLLQRQLDLGAEGG